MTNLTLIWLLHRSPLVAVTPLGLVNPAITAALTPCPAIEHTLSAHCAPPTDWQQLCTTTILTVDSWLRTVTHRYAHKHSVSWLQNCAWHYQTTHNDTTVKGLLSSRHQLFQACLVQRRKQKASHTRDMPTLSEGCLPANTSCPSCRHAWCNHNNQQARAKLWQGAATAGSVMTHIT